jgi:hypothetical protein
VALLDDIIEAAVDDRVPIGTLLRRCLVLEQTFHNEKFKTWLNKELDGYDKDDELPSYRKIHTISYGIFVGIAGRQLNNQPLALHVLDKKDREIMTTCPLTQPASSYEGRPNKSDDAQIPWNPSLTTKYQAKFFQDSDLVLNRAWQLIPGSVIVALLETVRTRVLRFALDLKNELGPSAPTVEKLPRATIERSVVNNIFGGNILIASHAEHTSQLSHTTIAAGDMHGLKVALGNLGISPSGVAALETAIAADGEGGQPTIGPRIKAWLQSIAKYVGKEGLKVGADVAKALATKWILQQYGLDVDN